MRPNLAFGSIDSVLHHLFHLSIVVAGVLQPLLVQKWRQRREHAACDAALADAPGSTAVPPA